MRNVLALSAVLILAGCGNSHTKSSTATLCGGSGVPGAGRFLPSDFPTIDNETIVTARREGRTRLLDGFTDRTLQHVYFQLGLAFDQAGYTITKKHLSKDDALFAYESTGNVSTGEVDLRPCDPRTTSIHIADRLR
jgi:hypothetical protein